MTFVGSDQRGSMGGDVRDFHGFSWLAGNGAIAATLPEDTPDRLPGPLLGHPIAVAILSFGTLRTFLASAAFRPL